MTAGIQNPWDLPQICSGCNREDCAGEPNICEREASERNDDIKYQRLKEDGF